MSTVLLKLCKSTGLRILNGRHRSGFANDYTYCGATSLSVIDYLISTIDLFNYVDKFIISNFNEYADHASLHVEFLVRNVSENSNTSKVNDDNKGDSRKLFRWNDEYKLQCREELSSNVDQLNLLCENLNFESQENLDKPWLTDECKRLYRNYTRCLNIFNHEKSSVNHSNLIEANKKYNKLESRLKMIYKRQQGNMLEGLRTIKSRLKMIYKRQQGNMLEGLRTIKSRLKMIYKRQQGNMLEGLRTINPKLFYGKPRKYLEMNFWNISRKLLRNCVLKWKFK